MEILLRERWGVAVLSPGSDRVSDVMTSYGTTSTDSRIARVMVSTHGVTHGVSSSNGTHVSNRPYRLNEFGGTSPLPVRGQSMNSTPDGSLGGGSVPTTHGHPLSDDRRRGRTSGRVGGSDGTRRSPYYHSPSLNASNASLHSRSPAGSSLGYSPRQRPSPRQQRQSGRVVAERNDAIPFSSFKDVSAKGQREGGVQQREGMGHNDGPLPSAHLPVPSTRQAEKGRGLMDIAAMELSAVHSSPGSSRRWMPPRSGVVGSYDGTMSNA